ncbi:MAG: hypothetical protein WDO68_07540 [Gammaproteobacteria bacterium]
MDKADTVIIRRKWNAADTTEVGVDTLWDLHFRDEPGGVCRALPRAFLSAYVWCDKLPAGGLAHQCRADPPPPHDLLVCILPGDNLAGLYNGLRTKARG